MTRADHEALFTTCLRCGYSLVGLRHDRTGAVQCPECGELHAPNAGLHERERVQQSRRILGAIALVFVFLAIALSTPAWFLALPVVAVLGLLVVWWWRCWGPRSAHR